MKKTIHEFATIIRNKFKGSYDDLTDVQLVTQILRRYPIYQDMVDISGLDVNFVTKKTDIKDVSSNFSCVLNNSYWGKLIQQTGNPNYITATVDNIEGRNFNFYSNGKFIYNDIQPYKTNIQGTWSCNGDNNFIVKTQDDSMFDSKLDKWTYHVSEKPPVHESEIIKKIVLKNLKTLIK